jgi:hypothetical protein
LRPIAVRYDVAVFTDWPANQNAGAAGLVKSGAVAV